LELLKEAAAGREIEGALAEDAGHQLVRPHRLPQVGAALPHDAEHVADAAGVVHQVRDRHRRGARSRRHIR